MIRPAAVASLLMAAACGPSERPAEPSGQAAPPPPQSAPPFAPAAAPEERPATPTAAADRHWPTFLDAQISKPHPLLMERVGA